MKQIQAFVHRHRAADLMHALEAEDFHRISVLESKGLPPAGRVRDAEYSVQLAESVVHEAQILVVCADEAVPTAIAVLQRSMHASRRDSGWLCVVPVEEVVALGDA